MIKTIDLNFAGQSKTIGAFLYETSEGPVLLETGPFSCYPTLCKGIRELGYAPEDIRHVFVTHVHLDHAGAAWAFAKMGAKIYTHPAGKNHLVDPAKLLASAERIYGDQMDKLWGDMRPISKQLVMSTKDAEMVRIGDTVVRSWHTPGHAKHHIAWQINRELVAGDVAGVKINEGPVVAPCPPPDIDLEDWAYSIRRMKALDLNRLHLTHFGSLVNIPSHLEELEKILIDWSEWIRPFAEDGTPKDKVIALFEDYVNGQLKAAGLDDATIKKYEKANPAWMSVYGLTRFWSKKLKLVK